MTARRLALFAPNLSGGGAERTLARLATHWSEQGREVTLVTLADASPDDFPLPTTVRRIGLGLTADSGGPLGAVRNNLRRIRALRETFRSIRPDVIVSFIEQANVLALLAARPLDFPVVVSERTDPARHRVGRLWDWLRRRTYPRCAALVVLTDEIAAAMRPVARGQPVVVIPNGVAPATVPRVPEDRRTERTILAIGRLSPEKGFDRLIKAFRWIAAENGLFPPWRLVILGDGPERSRLKGLARSCPPESVALPGRVDDPADWLARADLFALPSRYEGFPNALLEAMAAGIPAVAFDGSPAVRRIIRPGIDGLLAPEPEDPKGDVAELIGTLQELAADDDRRRRMGDAAREVVSRYSLAEFYARWDAVLESAANGNFRQAFAPKRE
ncbi:MAG: glycosyltransferase family 4 protein [Planctomycetaceae bacterium]